MVLFILTETSAGYALLKAKDKKLLKSDTLATDTATAEGTSSLLKLKEFKKFDNAASALEEAAALTDGKVCTRHGSRESALSRRETRTLGPRHIKYFFAQANES